MNVCVCMYVYMDVCMYVFVCMSVSMYCCMTTSMYCLNVGIDYTYIDINALAQGINPIRPQYLVSHANHSATETSMYVCMYVCIY